MRKNIMVLKLKLKRNKREIRRKYAEISINNNVYKNLMYNRLCKKIKPHC